jgi:hypothetical protein
MLAHLHEHGHHHNQSIDSRGLLRHHRDRLPEWSRYELLADSKRGIQYHRLSFRQPDKHHERPILNAHVVIYKRHLLYGYGLLDGRRDIGIGVSLANRHHYLLGKLHQRRHKRFRKRDSDGCGKQHIQTLRP